MNELTGSDMNDSKFISVLFVQSLSIKGCVYSAEYFGGRTSNEVETVISLSLNNFHLLSFYHLNQVSGSTSMKEAFCSPFLVSSPSSP
jgi:hypothetical protein